MHCCTRQTSNGCIPLQSCTVSQDLGTRLGFPALRSPCLHYFTPPRRDFCIPLESPLSLQAVRKPGLPLLPPPTTTLSCSSLHSATNSPNQRLFLQPLKRQPGSFLPAVTPPRVSLPSCCCVYKRTTSLFCLLHWSRRGLRMAHEFLDSWSSSFCPAGFKNSLSACPSSPQPAKSDQQSTWPLVPVA